MRRPAYLAHPPAPNTPLLGSAPPSYVLAFACLSAWLLTQVMTKTNYRPAHSKNEACPAPADGEPPVSPSPSALKLEELSLEVINKLMSLGEPAVILKDKAS